MMRNKPFSTRLRAARLAKSAALKKATGARAGLSQESLGIAVGIAEETASARMNQYEQGVHLPDLEMAARLAKELDVPLAYLFCEENEVAELLLAIHRVSARRRHEVIREILSQITQDGSR